MKGIGIDQKELEERKYLHEGQTPIAERSFHLIFGGTLLWGFLLNVLLVLVAQKPMVNMLLSSGSAAPMIIAIVVYFGLVIAGNALMHSGDNIKAFLGFNLIAVPVGLLVSVAVYGYQPNLVLHAMTLTGAVTALMMLISAIKPEWFAGLGRMLGISLICCIIAEAITAIFFPAAGFGVFDWVVAALMCLYIGYDWYRLGVCARTAENAICMAAALYLDIINLFLRILRILSKSKD